MKIVREVAPNPVVLTAIREAMQRAGATMLGIYG